MKNFEVPSSAEESLLAYFCVVGVFAAAVFVQNMFCKSAEYPRLARIKGVSDKVCKVRDLISRIELSGEVEGSQRALVYRLKIHNELNGILASQDKSKAPRGAIQQFWDKGPRSLLVELFDRLDKPVGSKIENPYLNYQKQLSKGM